MFRKSFLSGICFDVDEGGSAGSDDDLELDTQELDTAGDETQQHTAEDDEDLLDREILEIGEGENIRRLKGSEVLARFSRADELEAENQKLLDQVKIFETIKPLLGRQAPAEEAKPQIQAQEQPVFDPKQVGLRLVKMLEGEEGGPEAIGQALLDLIDSQAEAKFQHLTGKNKAVETFTSEFTDFESKEAEVLQFMRQNPHISNPVVAYLVMRDRSSRQEMESLKKQVEEAKTTGKVEGAKETIKTMKARGTLRLLGTGGARLAAKRAAADANDYSDSQTRQAAMLARLVEMRGGSAN